MSTAIGIGEILWDVFPEEKKLGGAPANFAFHASQLGIQTAIISAVGNDGPGREILDTLDESSIINFVQVNEKPTGSVSVELDNHGIPSYIIHEQVAWDFIQKATGPGQYAATADAICFGSLAQRSPASRTSIHSYLQQADNNALRIFDINLRQKYFNREIIESSLMLANVLKINEDEISVLAEMFDIRGGQKERAHNILSRFDLRFLALTKGEQGSWLFDIHESSFFETPHVKVVDTVGAGDSFTAALTAGFLKKRPLRNIHKLAVEVSAYVCTQAGATPALPDTLTDKFK